MQYALTRDLNQLEEEKHAEVERNYFMQAGDCFHLFFTWSMFFWFSFATEVQLPPNGVFFEACGLSESANKSKLFFAI
jgi:hypothetical protein